MLHGPLVGTSRPTDLNEFDLDAMCCTMLTQDLPELFGAIAPD